MPVPVFIAPRISPMMISSSAQKNFWMPMLASDSAKKPRLLTPAFSCVSETYFAALKIFILVLRVSFGAGPQNWKKVSRFFLRVEKILVSISISISKSGKLSIRIFSQNYKNFKKSWILKIFEKEVFYRKTISIFNFCGPKTLEKNILWPTDITSKLA